MNPLSELSTLTLFGSFPYSFLHFKLFLDFFFHSSMSGCHLEDIENGTFKAMQNLTELWVNFFLDIIIDFSDVRAIDYARYVSWEKRS